MKFVKHTALLATFAVFGLVGCGGDKPANNASASADTKTETTTKTTDVATNSAGVAGGKKYTVITTGTAEPFSMKDERGVMSGIDVDIIKEVANVEGFAVDFHELPWQQVLGTIESGEYDIAINGINYSEERNSKYGLTNAYFYNPSAFMYKKDSPAQPKSLADLSGLTVAVMKDAKQDIEASAVAGTEVVRKPNLFVAYKAMLKGEAQVVSYDMAVLQSLVKKHNDTTVTIVPYEDKSNKNTYNVFVVNKNNAELLATLNSGLDKLEKSGKLAEIRKKYVGE